jgi:hypothetical protein
MERRDPERDSRRRGSGRDSGRRGSGRDVNDARTTQAESSSSGSGGSREIYRQAAERTTARDQLRQYYDQLDTNYTQATNNLTQAESTADSTQRDFDHTYGETQRASDYVDSFNAGFHNGSIALTDENVRLYDQAVDDTLSLRNALHDATARNNEAANNFNNADNVHKPLKIRFDIREMLNRSNNVEASIQSYNRGFEAYRGLILRNYPHLAGPINDSLSQIGQMERSQLFSLERSNPSDEQQKRNIRIEALAQKKESLEKIETDEMQRLVDQADGIS